MTKEDKRLYKEVNIQSSQLSYFTSSKVFITLIRDHLFIYRVGRRVNNKVMLLIPAKVDNIKVQKTIVNISNIANCTTLPEDWEEHEKGPAQYIAEQATSQVERPQQKGKRHK